MPPKVCELIIPDAGPLITLAYAGRFDLLLATQAKVVVIDMVKIELTRHLTQTSQMIIDFIADRTRDPRLFV
jgi:predicted nucleic acid-binding protein